MIRSHSVARSSSAQYGPAATAAGSFFGTTEFVALKLHDAAGVKATDQLPQHRSINQTT